MADKTLFADVVSIITPEDGAVDGKLREDWLAICLEAAEHAMRREQEFRDDAAVRYPNPDRQREYFARAMMREALAHRDKLLGRHDG